MGTRVGMEHVQERPYVQLFTSHHTHINIPTCGVFTITNHASRLVFRNDPDFKWPPQSMYYT